LGDDALAELLDEILLYTDDTWMSEDGIVALTTAMLGGAVLSHRITESELEREVLDATPDLGAIDFDSSKWIRCCGNGQRRPIANWNHVGDHAGPGCGGVTARTDVRRSRHWRSGSASVDSGYGADRRYACIKRDRGDPLGPSPMQIQIDSRYSAPAARTDTASVMSTTGTMSNSSQVRNFDTPSRSPA
jgi:hypothetical protein